MDMVIIMEPVNTPMKDIVYRHNTKDGGAIRDAITRYFAEYLQDNGKAMLSTNLFVLLIWKSKTTFN